MKRYRCIFEINGGTMVLANCHEFPTLRKAQAAANKAAKSDTKIMAVQIEDLWHPNNPCICKDYRTAEGDYAESSWFAACYRYV